MTAHYPLTNTINFPFRDVWSISDCQKGLLTCASMSPSGVLLVSCAQDGTILFIDHKAGALIGILNLDSQFCATAVTWQSDTVLIFGCSNGVVYHLDIEHKSKRPVSVHTLIKPLKAPVRYIAFDSFRDTLAIACGGEVWIYVRSAPTGSESWDCVDHILAPCAGAPGLVTALSFFGATINRRHLFIGHAKSGWTIWLAPRSYHRTPYVEKGDVCTIGSATIPPSEQFIAIATLDHDISIVTYSLHEGGPDVDTRAEFSSRELSNYRPVLPIVSTPSDLVLKGTVVGDIEVLDRKTHSTASLHHAHNHIIRTLNAYGDKVVVGSSNLSDDSTSSCLRCYTFSSAAEPRDWRRIDEYQGPTFEVTLSSMLPLSERIMLRNHLWLSNIVQATRFNMRWGRRASLILIGLSGLFLTIALSPPAASSHAPVASTKSIRISGTPYSQSAVSRNPTLSALILWCVTYVTDRLSTWCIWIGQAIMQVAKLGSIGVLILVKNLLFVLRCFIRAVILIPHAVKETLSVLPDILATFICDILKSQGFDDVCPE